MDKAKKGIAEHEYHVGKNSNGLQAPNRAHNLRTYFNESGIQIKDRSAKGSPTLFDLSVESFGRENSKRTKISKSKIHNEKNRVEIKHKGFTEWYENSPKGLEQGYNVASAGDINGDGYSDVSIGALLYNNNLSFSGEVFVFHGNNGNTGKPLLVSQLTGDGTSSIQSLYLSKNDSTFQVSMQAFLLNGNLRQVKLEVLAWEFLGSPF